MEERIELRFVVVAFKRGPEDGAKKIRVVGSFVVGGFRYELVVGSFDEPVEGFARMVVPVVEEIRVGTVAHVFHELIDYIGFRCPLDADALLNFGIDDAECSSHADDADIVLPFNADDAGTCFGGGARCRYAR